MQESTIQNIQTSSNLGRRTVQVPLISDHDENKDARQIYGSLEFQSVIFILCDDLDRRRRLRRCRKLSPYVIGQGYLTFRESPDHLAHLSLSQLASIVRFRFSLSVPTPLLVLLHRTHLIYLKVLFWVFCGAILPLRAARKGIELVKRE